MHTHNRLPGRLLLAIAVAAALGGSLFAAAQPVLPSPLLRAYLAGDTLYPDSANASGDLERAIHQATRERKHVLLDFGGNWCPDCRVLDIYFHDPSNVAQLQQNFVVVHINVGHLDQNTSLAEKYGIPLKKGVPALAVLDSRGRLLYSQRHGEFEAMRRLDSATVTRFLMQWKPRS